jgi:Xaa-Pro aminopeptidase
MNGPTPPRLDAFIRCLRRRRLDAALLFDEANIRSLTGVACDNAALEIVLPGAGAPPQIVFYTDFRYVPMVHRVAPWLRVEDIRRLPVAGKRIGYEPSMPHARFLRLQKKNRRAVFVDVERDVLQLRAVKTDDEIEKIRAAESLTCAIWEEARRTFRAGMTEREMARAIRRRMIDLGDGEAFDTIVCVGANAAECHHVPDETVWNGRESVLIDMGVKLDGWCSDLTRNIVPPRPSARYREIYSTVERANRAAIAAVRPGLTCGELDETARRIIADAGFGAFFGHSLGHGVGLAIHEAPSARKGDETVLKPGMLVTIEPGIYLEGELGVRIEDLVLVTETGCEVLSA